MCGTAGFSDFLIHLRSERNLHRIGKREQSVADSLMFNQRSVLVVCQSDPYKQHDTNTDAYRHEYFNMVYTHTHIHSHSLPVGVSW